MAKRKFNTFEEFKDAVCAEVEKKIGKEPWFRGVCVDGLVEYFPRKFRCAVDYAYMNTSYHDAPEDFIFG